MPDTKQLLRETRDRITPPSDVLDGLERRRDRVRRNQRIRAGVLGIAIAILVGWWGIHEIRSTAPRPANDRSAELGIFAPVAGRIVYSSGDLGLWAVDPSAPSASTLVRLSPEEGFPGGWSSDGTRLLLVRQDPTDQTFPYDEHLFILHADGTETQVTPEPVDSAAISSDGSKVVYSSASRDGLYAVDAEGGEPALIAEVGEEPTFSPDGTQIAYLGLPRRGGQVEGVREHVWVANADGSDAHEILTDEPVLEKGVFGLRWSPAGDRIAMENTLGGHVAIYTFAPDGSDFTKVVAHGFNPYWSPDGSRIAYMLPYGRPHAAGAPLAIAEADGSNVQVFGFGGVGPWHPGIEAADEPSPDGGDAPELASDGKDVLDRISDGEVVHLWPDTSRNRPGLYSWDGPDPAAAGRGRIVGFMHNGYGSGDVEIFLEVVPEETIPVDATATGVAGHDAMYRRIDAEREEWIVDILGTRIAIRLESRPGTSQADLADAYAIIGSMRTEPQANDLGFRLVFALTTNEWDSG